MNRGLRTFVFIVAFGVFAGGIIAVSFSKRKNQVDIQGEVRSEPVKTATSTPKPTGIIEDFLEPTEALEPTVTTAASQYPIHKDIVATVFWVGEEAGPDNDFSSNKQSAWDSNWLESFGGVDTPDRRNGWYPEDFTPLENPFYIALPYSDFDESGRRGDIARIPWYEADVSEGQSLIKNRWLKIYHGERVCFAQWENAGPFFADDVDYVFGSLRPRNTFGQGAGIDVSPAVRDCLGMGETGVVSWQFVEAGEVSPGPWEAIITTSGPKW